MTETSNYALNIVEGSDLFNPLTQFNPNFEQIDTVMAENEQAGVGTATELKSGTTHAIIRENDNRSMFYFTATSDYEAGDTFTVDGAVVTAKLPSGESLGAGAFVVNSTVLCSIVGSLLTVYSSKGGITTAADSERLGGELPAYYATAEELLATDAKADSAGSVAQSANAISIQNQSAINLLNTEIESKVGNYSTTEYAPVTGLAYDSVNKKLGLRVGASTEIIPFSGETDLSRAEIMLLTIVGRSNTFILGAENGAVVSISSGSNIETSNIRGVSASAGVGTVTAKTRGRYFVQSTSSNLGNRFSDNQVVEAEAGSVLTTLGTSSTLSILVVYLGTF